MDIVKFAIGELVYLKILPDDPGIVTGILFRPHSQLYFITWGDLNETTHYDIELTTKKLFEAREA
jgi:hypothetical protein